jgi:Peptidase_C39 like family
MTRNAIINDNKMKTVGGLAAAIIGLTGLFGTAHTTAAHAAEPTTAASTQAALVTTAASADNSDHGTKQLPVNYQAQPNFYWCGPAAARNALTTTGHDITMADLAHQMGTTEAGTNSANDITAALNKVTGNDKYHTTELTKPTVSPEQADTVKHDIITTIDDNRAVVANVAGTATDTDGETHSYQGGHYIAIHGYRDNGNQVEIADSANPNTAHYWINTTDLANWMATRGYSH